MNPFDMVVVVMLVYFVITGLLRGSIREITSIAALLGGFFCAFFYYEPFAAAFSFFIKAEHIRNIVSFLILFCIVALTVTFIGIALRNLLRFALLGAVDRLLGAVIGAAKAVIVISVVHFLALTFLPPGGAAVVGQSKMAPAINNAAASIVYMVPEEVKNDLSARMHKLSRQWQDRQEDT